MTTLNSKEQFLSFKQSWAKAAKSGKLCSAHHLLYNILLERDISTGFTPRTNLGHIQACEGGVTHGLWAATLHLKTIISYDDGRAELIELFDGTITEGMLRIIVPSVQALPFNYGLGKKVFDHFTETDTKNITFDQLWGILNDVAA